MIYDKIDTEPRKTEEPIYNLIHELGDILQAIGTLSNGKRFAITDLNKTIPLPKSMKEAKVKKVLKEVYGY